MKWTTVLVLVVVVAVVAEARLTSDEKAAKKAERKAARKAERKSRKACKYDFRGATCDQASQKMVAPLIAAESTDPSCPATKALRRNCNQMRCIYNKREACKAAVGATTATAQLVADRSDAACPATKEYECRQRKNKTSNRCVYIRQGATCDEATKKMRKPLRPGSPATCDPFKEKTVRKCPRVRECKYKRGIWSGCDPVTNKKVMVETLKRGDPASCNKTITKKKECRQKPKRDVVCKYRRTQWSDCDPVSNKKVMIKTLKSGKTSECQPTQTVEKLCKRKKKDKKNRKEPCRYKKKKWGACNPRTNTVSRLLTLRKGNIGECQATKIITRPCRKNKKKSGGCKYDKSQWGPCNAASNTVTRTLTLKSGDPEKCNATRIDVRKCKDKHLRPHVCKYKRGTWSECNPVTNMKVMVKMLKRGDPAHCEASQTVEKKCKRKGPVINKVCKYKFEAWSDCDISTNTMTRRQTLKSGPSTCQPVKEYSKKCKVPCKYKQGEWSECDKENNQMTRTDTLNSGSADFCGKTRVLTKKCNKKGKKCKYDFGVWGDCDVDTNKRTRLRTLISGDVDCPQEKTISKTCTKSNGEARCFFGPWGEYDECQNGVKKKKRDVIQGGLECERKGVKMKSC